MLKGKLEISGDWLTDVFKAKTPPLIGVDISSSSVKMVELGDGGKGRIRLERYAIEPLPKDAVVDGNIMNLEAVGDSLRRGWKRMGSRIKNLAMALPSAQVITKKITVPAGLREDELMSTPIKGGVLALNISVSQSPLNSNFPLSIACLGETPTNYIKSYKQAQIKQCLFRCKFGRMAA